MWASFPNSPQSSGNDTTKPLDGLFSVPFWILAANSWAIIFPFRQQKCQ
jgi:hypothetical protein